MDVRTHSRLLLHFGLGKFKRDTEHIESASMVTVDGTNFSLVATAEELGRLAKVDRITMTERTTFIADTTCLCLTLKNNHSRFHLFSVSVDCVRGSIA